MLKIGEFSKLTKVSVRMLHYYDDVGLLKPMQIDKITGYRFYSTTQLPILQKIVMLRDLNFQVPEIENLLNNWTDELLIEKLESQILEREKAILEERQLIENIRFAIDSVKNKKIDIHCNVMVKKIPAYKVISLRKIIPNHNHEGMIWKELLDYVRSKHINILKQNNNNIAIYHDVEHKEIGVDIEVAFLVKNSGISIEPFIYRKLESVDTMACMMVYGTYDNIAKAYHSFVYWLGEHSQYEMYGLSRQICHRDHTNEENPDNYLTEIQIPVRKNNDW